MKNVPIRIIGDPEDFSAIKLIRENRLPRSLAKAWKKGSGYDPYVAWWLLAFARLIPLLLCSLLIFVFISPDKKVTGWTGIIWGLSGIFAMGVGFPLLIWFYVYMNELEAKYVGAFSEAIYWILFLNPHTYNDLDEMVKSYNLRLLYRLCMEAEIINILLAELKKDEIHAELYRENLDGFWNGAVGFGFVEDPSKGKQPLFDEAKKTANYQQALKKHLRVLSRPNGAINIKLSFLK